MRARDRAGIGLSYRPARLNGLAGLYYNPIPARSLALTDCSKIPALKSKVREDCILRGPRLSFFKLPRNLSHKMIRQARIGDTVLVKSREMPSRTQTLPWWLEGEG